MNNFYKEIKKIKSEDCNDSLVKLINRYSPVFLSMYSKYCALISSKGADPNDILSDKDLIIYESAKSFDLTKKYSFCTWLSNNVKYRCLHLMNKKTKMSILCERFKNNKLEEVRVNPYSNIEMKGFIFNELEKLKDKRVSNVYKLRYYSGDKMTWANIGKNLGFSSQTAINLHKKGAEVLKRKIKDKK